MKKGKYKKVMKIALALVGCIFMIWSVRFYFAHKNFLQLETNKCAAYGIDVSQIHGTHKKYAHFTHIVDITAQTEEEKDYKQIFELLRELKNSSDSPCGYPNNTIVVDLNLNGDTYSSEWKTLRKNGEEVYTYRSDEEIMRDREEREAAEEADYPYEGMLEKYISYTKLGAPSESEKSLNYDSKKASHRYKKYKWYDQNGKLIATAQVGYWDRQKNRSREGYVYSVSYFGK